MTVGQEKMVLAYLAREMEDNPRYAWYRITKKSLIVYQDDGAKKIIPLSKIFENNA